ncbi:MAG: hypothetical protein WC869_00070 [Phycisphaerae bacterium]|jgi:hypothetical protein
MLKIVLDIPALERLMGGDTEVEVSLRKNIVEEFSKRHLLSVAREVFGDIERVKNDVKNQVLMDMHVVQMESWSSGRYKLTSEVRKIIEATVKEALVAEVNDATKAAWEELKPAIMAAIKQCYDREALALIKEQVKKDILAMLEQKEST